LIDLATYGWDAGWAEALRAGAADGRPGRIVRVDRGECDVVTTDGVVRAISDSTRAQGEVAPATGDWVVIDEGPDDKLVIAQSLPRRHTLIRRDPSEAVIDQVLVANVDLVAFVHGLDRPLPPGRLERFLVLAWDSGAEPVVILTKADRPELYAETRTVVEATAPAVRVIATRRDDPGSFAAVRALAAPRTTIALVGASGAGKSTLVNLLLGRERFATNEVRGSDAKGRHTTVARELVLIPDGGALVDTPGIRSVGVWADEDALHRVFADVDEHAENCRFRDCAHDQEPGCAVRDHVPAARLARYRALRAEIDEMFTREEERQRYEKHIRRKGPGRRRTSGSG
jgi:ribosome biogenesis GTPase / thiamine phosphate phosphatase